MNAPVACQGAPRDLGLDQGRACAAAIGGLYDARPLAERLRLRLARSDAASARVARDVARYFPRHAESLDGMATGARVPRAWLVSLLAAAPQRPGSGFAQPALAAAGPLLAGAPLLARGLPSRAVLRRVVPEGGFCALEIAPCWFAGALAGVSEAGLAVAVVQGAGAGAGEICAAPAALLVQDCLHRFESLDGALDWCLGRPAGGVAELLLADAAGEIARVSIAPAGRRVQRPADGLARAGFGERDAKALREAAPLRPDALPRVLERPLVLLDPASRRLGVADAPDGVAWQSL